MASHEPYTRVATINGKPAMAIPMVTVPEDDLDLVVNTVEYLLDRTKERGWRLPERMAAELPLAIAQLKRAMESQG